MHRTQKRHCRRPDAAMTHQTQVIFLLMILIYVLGSVIAVKPFNGFSELGLSKLPEI